MKRRIKKLVCGFFAIALAMGICVKSPANTYADEVESISGEITVYGNISDTVMQKYLQGFCQKYPQISVNYRSYSNYEEEMQKRIEENDYGDVLMTPSFISQDSYSKYFALLGDYNTLSQKYRFIDNQKDEKGNIYTLPSSAHIMGIMYNQDVFYKAGISEIPKTIEDFLVALDVINERTDAIPFYTNYSDAWALQSWTCFPYIEMTGDADYKENIFIDEINPFSEGTTHYQVYELLYEIVNRGLAGETPLETNWEASKTMMNNGEIACMAIGSWALAQFQSAGENGESIAFMPFPNEVEETQYMTIAADYCYAINKNSQNKDAARAYIDYMLDESGYALEQKTISIVKTDPYPEEYGAMENVVLLSSNIADSNNYKKYELLSTNLNLEDTAETKRVIEAAAGERNESFEAIMEDWNARWEASRSWEVADKSDVAAILEGSTVSEAYAVEFSETEQAYLQDKELLKIGYLKNLAPIQFETEEGFEGVAAYICNAIMETTGLSAEFYAYENTEQMVEALEAGEIEIIAGMEKNDAYQNQVQYSKGYIDYVNVLIKNETADAVDLKENRMGIVRGENTKWDTVADSKKELATFADVLKSIENLETDFTVANYYSANYYARQEDCAHIIMIPLSEEGVQYLGFSTAVDTRLISICNKCIYSLPEENIQLELLEHMDPEVENVTLKRYIEANPFQAIFVMAAAFLFVLVVIIWIMWEKEKHERERTFNMERYQILSTLMDEYIFEGDFDGKTMHFDKKFAEYFDFGGDIDLNHYQKKSEQLDCFLRQIDKIWKGQKENSAEFQLENKNGEVFWYKLVAHRIEKGKGNMKQLIGKMVCVQEEVEEKQLMRDKAEKDPLTGIFNRDGFVQKIETILTQEKSSISYAVMDIDNFKKVNDTLGHAGGDVALKILAEQLKNLYPEKSIPARYGGDEFVLLIWDTEKQKVEELLQSLVTTMNQEIVYQGAKKTISISLGAVYTTQKIPYHELFEKADEILYEVKKNGKNMYKLMEQ